MKFKKIKNLFPLFLISFAILFSPITASAEVLFGKAYHQALHQYLAQSKSSITIAMYFIIINPADPTDPVNELVNDLINAKNRGVAIKVVLEDSKLKENRLAYEKLRANNITVYFDTAEHLLHIKEVVIDGRYVFAGSANWSKAAIEDNYEATYFEDSVPDALASKKYIDNIPIQKKDIFLLPTPAACFLRPRLLSNLTSIYYYANFSRKQLNLLWILTMIT